MRSPVQPDAVTNLQNARNLMAEAAGLEVELGPNAYSKYLRQNGRRPDPITAAAIGRLLGGRVRADDGSMQPRPTAAGRKAQKARQEAFERRYEQVAGLKAGIALLAMLRDDAEIAGELVSFDVVADINTAVCCLQRIAGQIHGWKQIENAANSNAYCRSDEQGDAQRRDTFSTHGDRQERQSEDH